MNASVASNVGFPGLNGWIVSNTGIQMDGSSFSKDNIPLGLLSNFSAGLPLPMTSQSAADLPLFAGPPFVVGNLANSSHVDLDSAQSDAESGSSSDVGGDSKYKCTLCHRQFSKESSLKNHVKSHNKVLLPQHQLNQLSDYNHRHHHLHNNDDNQALMMINQQLDLSKHQFSAVISGAEIKSERGVNGTTISTIDSSGLMTSNNTENSAVIGCGSTNSVTGSSNEQHYQCNVCGKSMKSAARLYAHFSSVHAAETSQYSEQGVAASQGEGGCFTCRVCGMGFRQGDELQTHLQTHSEERPFVCNVCSHRFKRSDKLMIHMRIHTGERKYACPDCDMRFMRSDHLKNHRRTHSGERPYNCNQCNAKFIRSDKLTQHLKSHMGGEGTGDLNNSAVIGMTPGMQSSHAITSTAAAVNSCTAAINSCTNMNLVNVNAMLDLISSASAASASNTINSSSVGLASCQWAGFKTPGSLSLDDIKGSDAIISAIMQGDLTGVKRFREDDDDEEGAVSKKERLDFVNLSHMYNSVTSVTSHDPNNKISDSLTQHFYPLRSPPIDHRPSVVPNPPAHPPPTLYPCMQTGMIGTYRFSANLLNQLTSTAVAHAQAKVKDKPFQCSQCDARFARQSGLSMHVLTHSGANSQQCPMCEQTFFKVSQLKSHLSQHHGLSQPVKCDQCQKEFSRADRLKNHLKTHSTERKFSCTECDKTFNRSDHLKIHMRIHTGEKPYQCSLCDKAYTRSDKLKKHIKWHEMGGKEGHDGSNEGMGESVALLGALVPKIE